VPDIGDQIQVMGAKVGQATRSGVVTDIRGRKVTAQWATGDQSVFVPAPGTLTVLRRTDTRRRSAKASRSAQGAIPARPSTTNKKAARKTPVRKTAKKDVAKTTAHKTRTPKTTKTPTAQRRTTVTKKAAPRRVR
jgi:hypothetical protein